ncbi:hypothetical protein P7K49_039318, partial [Saguinus oedipus]
TDGALLPGNLRSGFLLESATRGSAFPELQTPVSRGTSPAHCHKELPRRGNGKTAAPATEVTLATRGAPPLEIFWSVGDE